MRCLILLAALAAVPACAQTPALLWGSSDAWQIEVALADRPYCTVEGAFNGGTALRFSVDRASRPAAFVMRVTGPLTAAAQTSRRLTLRFAKGDPLPVTPSVSGTGTAAALTIRLTTAAPLRSMADGSYLEIWSQTSRIARLSMPGLGKALGELARCQTTVDTAAAADGGDDADGQSDVYRGTTS